MSYQDQRGGCPPPQDGRDSEYPPPPGDEQRPQLPTTTVSMPPHAVTLPSIAPYNAQYAAPPPAPYGSPSPQPYGQDPYRSPPHPHPPQPGYGDPNYPQGYGGMPPQQPPQPGHYAQSAPRQRTAIACRYCRRRKIRCSGFDTSAEGRCSNCVRFSQDCIFTPVSSQAQAFVPAHAVYPHMRNMAVGPDGTARVMVPPGTQLYGAHGQPLSQATQQMAPGGQPFYAYSQSPPPPAAYAPYVDGQRPETQAVNGVPTTYAPYGRQEEGRDVYLPQPGTSAPSAANYSPGSSTSSQGPYLQAGQQGPSLTRTPPPRGSPGDGRQDPMSLGNIMERQPDAQIDRSMLGRLDRRSQQPPNQP